MSLNIYEIEEHGILICEDTDVPVIHVCDSEELPMRSGGFSDDF